MTRPSKAHPFAIPDRIASMIEAGALVAINHSGGKDSQAMTLKLIEAGIPLDQIIIIHAHLGRVEWPGVIAHIVATTFGLPLIIARANKTFFDMVRHRGMFPSPQYRQCTSDLKRGPIQRELRRYLKAHTRFNGQIINCMGMRAEESPARSKRPAISYSKSNSVAGRVWLNWLPIHDMTSREVFATIRRAGQKPHWAYGAGMSRLSCSFCIMSSRDDLQCAARLRPELAADYIALEQEVGHTMSVDGTSLAHRITHARQKINRG